MWNTDFDDFRVGPFYDYVVAVVSETVLGDLVFCAFVRRHGDGDWFDVSREPVVVLYAARNGVAIL